MTLPGAPDERWSRPGRPGQARRRHRRRHATRRPPLVDAAQKSPRRHARQPAGHAAPRPRRRDHRPTPGSASCSPRRRDAGRRAPPAQQDAAAIRAEPGAAPTCSAAPRATAKRRTARPARPGHERRRRRRLARPSWPASPTAGRAGVSWRSAAGRRGGPRRLRAADRVSGRRHRRRRPTPGAGRVAAALALPSARSIRAGPSVRRVPTERSHSGRIEPREEPRRRPSTYSSPEASPPPSARGSPPPAWAAC